MFGNMDAIEARLVKQREDENNRLKLLVAGQARDIRPLDGEFRSDGSSLFSIRRSRLNERLNRNAIVGRQMEKLKGEVSEMDEHVQRARGYTGSSERHPCNLLLVRTAH